MSRRLAAALLLFMGVLAIGFGLKIGGNPAVDPYLARLVEPGRTASGFWLMLSRIGQGQNVAAVAFLGALLLWLQSRRRAAVVLVLTVAAQMATNPLLKLLFSRMRPDLYPHLDQVFDLSYPSGHSAQNACLYLLLALLLHRHSAWIGVPLALLIGTSRVVLGVHWPTDVLGGWMEGAAFALLGSSLVEPRRVATNCDN